MRMTDALNEEQCDTVRGFFELLLKIRSLDKRKKGVSVATALDIWLVERYGHTRRGLTNQTHALARNMSDVALRRLDSRREWWEKHPDATFTEASAAWGCSPHTAYQWMRHERMRKEKEQVTPALRG